MVNVLLHIGTFKTGTTSLQQWFNDHAEEIESETNIRWFRGLHPDGRELAAICMDEDKETPAMSMGFFPMRNSPKWETWKEEVRANIQGELQKSNSTMFVSCEALCLLRTDSELSRLKELFPPENCQIILVLREPKEFLKSWRKHLQHDFLRRSNNRKSFAYVKSDTWLVNYSELMHVYRKHYFGGVEIINYEVAVSAEGSIIPAITKIFNPQDAPLPDCSKYHLNKSSRPPRRPIKGLAHPQHYFRFYFWQIQQRIKTPIRLALRR
ncbi:MAG: hypothetical protein EBY23_05405 [Actinobacteria bacterium]|jgi:hypothetical protein|nr:hypothetical protein [Actinomycetota bacterium]